MPQRANRFATLSAPASTSAASVSTSATDRSGRKVAGAATEGSTEEALLRTLIPPERQQALARSMLRASRNASGPLRGTLSKALQHEFRLNGMPRAASEQRDMTQVTTLAARSDRALAALARIWLVANEELRERVLLHLQPYGFETAELDITLQGFWETESAAPAFARAQAEMPDLHADDLLLAWTLLSGRLLLPYEQRPAPLLEQVTSPDAPFPSHPDDVVTPESFTHELWATVVGQVAELPDDDPAWSELDQAVGMLQRLAATRQSRREARWAPLRSALVALQGQPPRVLADLEITGIANWSAEQCPPEQVDEIATAVAALERDVTDFADLQTRMTQQTRATFSERRDAREQEIALGDRIVRAFATLDALLAAPDGAPTPTPPPAPTAPPERPASSPATIDADVQVDDDADREHAAGQDVAAAVVGTPPEHPTTMPRQVLYTVPEAARLVLASEGMHGNDTQADHAGVAPELATTLLWAFAADGDVAAASWIAQSLDRHELATSFSGVVGAALATSRNRIGHDLTGLHATRTALDGVAAVSDDEQNPVRLLRLAAAMRPAMLIPHSGMSAWLYQDAETHLAGIDGVLDEIRRLPALPQGSPQADTDQRWEREQEIARIVAQARRMRQQPPGFPFGGGQPLWRQLMQESELGTVLNGVADDARDDRERVRAAAEQWNDSGWRDSEIQRQHRRCSSGHTSADDPFDGRSLHTMQREIGDLLFLGAQWLQQVDALDLLDRGGDRFANQSQAQRSRLAQRLPEAFDDLRTLQERSQPVSVQAVARVFTWALQDIATELRVDAPGERALPLAAPVGERTRRLGSASTLASALANRISDLPGISLDWHDQPSSSDLRWLPELLARSAL